MRLLQMSVTGAVLIGVILLIRRLLIYRLPKKTFFVLWSIALARLLIPFSIPSRFSIYTWFVQYKRPAEVFVSYAPVQSLTQEDVLASDTLSSGTGGQDPWLLVWLIGMMLCAAFFMLAYWKCAQEFRTATPIEDPLIQAWCHTHSLYRTISVRQTDLVESPLTFGILHPVILLPKNMDWSDETTLAYVLTHEYVHIRRFDSLTKLLVIAAACIHWFNPLVWVLYVQVNRDLELSCDEAVVRLFGEKDRSAYARALIRMEEQACGFLPLCSYFTKNPLEERIEAIMKTKKTTIFSLLLAGTIVTGTAAAFVTSSQLADSTVLLTNGETATEQQTTEWWTAEEYEAWLRQEKEELQSLVGTGSGWYDAQGTLHVFTQEIVDQTIAGYEKTLQEIKAGKRHAKPVDVDVDGDGTPDYSITRNDTDEPAVEADASYVVQDAGVPATLGTKEVVTYVQENGSAASEDNSPEAVASIAEHLKQYEKWGITYTPENGGNVYYQGKLIRRFEDINMKTSIVMTVESASGGDQIACTVYDAAGNITGVRVEPYHA